MRASCHLKVKCFIDLRRSRDSVGWVIGNAIRKAFSRLASLEQLRL